MKYLVDLYNITDIARIGPPPCSPHSTSGRCFLRSFRTLEKEHLAFKEEIETP